MRVANPEQEEEQVAETPSTRPASDKRMRMAPEEGERLAEEVRAQVRERIERVLPKLIKARILKRLG